jgi:bifunctional DNA-binding transcriptional regulator/antitoxin component of YhaV-PrlF toxin-antitoxin module
MHSATIDRPSPQPILSEITENPGCYHVAMPDEPDRPEEAGHPDRPGQPERLETREGVADGSLPPFRLPLGANGQVCLPPAVCERMGVAEGDYLTLEVEKDGSLRLTSLRSEMAKTREFFRDLAAEPSLSDELLAERRESARQENEE